MESELQRYKDFQPTRFDPKGWGCGSQQDWLVAPVSQTRDSDCLDRSNFRVVLADLGGESDNVEVHRFGHWGPGWFEIILVRPDTPQAAKADEWRRALENYPVADDMNFSELEFDEACAYWDSLSVCDRVEVCKRHDVSIFAARRNDLPEDDQGELISYLVRG